MAITSISRDWGYSPSIVRITTTDTLATVIANGYLLTQADEIEVLNKGAFTWETGDMVAIVYSGGKGFFNYSVDSAGLGLLTPEGAIQSQTSLTSAQILAMSVTPVQLVAAPGSNRIVVPVAYQFTYLFDTAQYAAGGAIGVEYGNTAALAGPAASTTLAAATFNGYAASNTFTLTPDVTDTLANVVNAGLFLSNTVGAFTTGAGTLKVNTLYMVVASA